MAVTLVIVALIPPLLETVTNSASTSEGISAGTGQANIAIENLTAQVVSADQICLPTQLTASGFTVRILQILSTSYTSAGAPVTTYRWDQWRLNSSNNKLEEEESATQPNTSASGIVWPRSNGSPQWVTVVQPIVNSSSIPPIPPFSLNNLFPGSPQSLAIDLQVQEAHGQKQQNKQLVELKSSVAALDTSYGSTTPISATLLSMLSRYAPADKRDPATKYLMTASHLPIVATSAASSISTTKSPYVLEEQQWLAPVTTAYLTASMKTPVAASISSRATAEKKSPPPIVATSAASSISTTKSPYVLEEQQWPATSTSSMTTPVSLMAFLLPHTKYTVAFNSDGGAAVASMLDKPYGSMTTLATLASALWRDAPADKRDPATNTSSMTTPVSLMAFLLPDKKTYTVTYNSNNATGGSFPVDGSSPYSSGATVTVLANTGNLVRTGYTFSGWNTAANGSGTAYAASGSATFTMPAANVILYAQWTVNPSYTVTFNNNGGTGSMTNETHNVPTALTLNTFTRTGYTFSGWNTAANGSGTAYADGATYPFTASVTLYAQWAATVIFNNNGGTGTMANETETVPTALTLNTFTRTGYTFSGWNTAANGSGTAYADGATYPFTVSVTLYAQWRATVTYNGNGATGGSVPVDGSSPYKSGSTVTVLGNTGNLVDTGYTFSGWNTAADGSGTAYLPGATFTILTNTTLYAQWRATVTYNGNGATGGSVPVDGSSPYKSGSTVTVLGNTGNLVDTGYTFSGWNTAANGTGTSYAAGNTFTISANTTLYAQWRATVTYNGNGATGGSVPVDGSSPYLSGSTVTVLGNTGNLVNTGYTFSGWNTAANGTGTSYAAGNTFTISGNTTLYAQWRATVTYNGNGATGGGSPVDGSSPYLSGSTVTVLGNTGSLVDTGYTFNGWNTAADGSGTSYLPGATFTISGNVTLYAKWSPNSDTVTYNRNGATGGSVPVDGSSPYLSGSTVTVLGNTGNLVNTGYTFSGWNTAANGTGTSYAAGNTFTISGNTTLYAQWTLPTYIVTFTANGGTGSMTPEVNSAPTALTLNTFTYAGYTFLGWNTAADGSGTSYADGANYPFTANATLYAQWTNTPLTCSNAYPSE